MLRMYMLHKVSTTSGPELTETSLRGQCGRRVSTTYGFGSTREQGLDTFNADNQRITGIARSIVLERVRGALLT
jgi:hypothetical protein